MLSDIALDIKEQLNDIDISLVVIFGCFLFCVLHLEREFNQDNRYKKVCSIER